MKKSGFIAILLAGVMLLGACSTGGTGNTGADSGQSADAAGDETINQEQDGEAAAGDSILKDGEITELLMVFPGSNSAPGSLGDVEDAINEILQETVDARIKIQIQEWGTYADQTNLMLSSGEKLDLFFSFSGTKDYVSKGQLYDITETVETYGKDVLELMSRYIDACYVDGSLYGLPTYHEYTSQAGLVCREDILEELGVDPAAVSAWDDVESILIQVQEAYPEMNVLVNAEQSRGPLEYYLDGVFDAIQSGVGAAVDQSGEGVTIINTYDTPEYRKMARKAYEWNEKGYFIADATTVTEDRQDLIRVGTSFGYIGKIHPGTKTQETQNSGKEIVTIPITNPIMTTNAVNFGQWTVPIACESPEKAVAFLNLLYSDPDVQNLIRYGIAGQDYEVNENGIAAYPEGVDAESVGWSNEVWLTGNASIAYPWETDPEHVWEVYEAFNSTSTLSPLYGFIYDSANVKNEITAIQNVLDKYQAVIEAGYAEPDSTVDKFVEELESAGIRKIVDDMQIQADEWLAQQ